MLNRECERTFVDTCTSYGSLNQATSLIESFKNVTQKIVYLSYFYVRQVSFYNDGARPTYMHLNYSSGLLLPPTNKSIG